MLSLTPASAPLDNIRNLITSFKMITSLSKVNLSHKITHCDKIYSTLYSIECQQVSMKFIDTSKKGRATYYGTLPFFILEILYSKEYLYTIVLSKELPVQSLSIM